jgi:FtsP/CotA-like multicopper oxidase with cupredoxin domain
MQLIFKINDKQYDPKRMDEHAQLGATEVWTVSNMGDMDHPFHLHGFQFQVLDRNGTAAPFVAWKDTVLVHASETVRFAVKLADFPGTRMYHCHILDHEDLGMMGMIDVQ